MNDQKIELSLALVNNVLNYLGSRPYAEVFQLVAALHGEAAPQISVPEAPASDEAAKPVEAAA